MYATIEWSQALVSYTCTIFRISIYARIYFSEMLSYGGVHIGKHGDQFVQVFSGIQNRL